MKSTVVSLLMRFSYTAGQLQARNPALRLRPFRVKAHRSNLFKTLNTQRSAHTLTSMLACDTFKYISHFFYFIESTYDENKKTYFKKIN